MVNGYVTLDLASKNIYKESLGAIKSGKPIMIVDTPDVYFADTIKATTINGDLVVQITKGGKTITINDANAVSSEGEIQNHLYAVYLSGNGDGGQALCTISNNDFSKLLNMSTAIIGNLSNNDYDANAKEFYEFCKCMSNVDCAVIDNSDDLGYYQFILNSTDVANQYKLEIIKKTAEDDTIICTIIIDNESITITGDNSEYCYIYIKKIQ